MTKRALRKIAAFYYKMAEILFIGVVIGGVMQPVMPMWKVLVGVALSMMTFVIAAGFDYAASNQKPT